MRKGFVYKTTCLINGKIYVGATHNHSPYYFGSGKFIKEALLLYGKDNFKKEILFETFVEKQLQLVEKHYIKFYDSTNIEIGYNIKSGGEFPGRLNVKMNKDQINKLKSPLIGRKFSKEHLERLSKSRKGKFVGDKNPNYGNKWSDEQKLRASESKKKKERRVTDEVRKKMSESKMGHFVSEETKKKMSESKMGKKFTENHKRNLSESKKGKILTEEHRKKIGDGNRGKKISKEVRKNMSDAQKRVVKEYNPKKFIVNCNSELKIG